MKTGKRPATAQPKHSTPPQPRQLGITFETRILASLANDQRAAAIHALTTLLQQAAGLHEQGDDDVEQ